MIVAKVNKKGAKPSIYSKSGKNYFLLNKNEMANFLAAQGAGTWPRGLRGLGNTMDRRGDVRMLHIPLWYFTTVDSWKLLIVSLSHAFWLFSQPEKSFKLELKVPI